MSVIYYDDYHNDWTCQPCDRHFVSRTAIDQHLEQSNAHDWCADCEEDFPSWRALRNHRVDEHFLCDPCDIRFSSQDDLDDHRGYEHFSCSLCGIFVSSERALDDHNADEHFFCRQCEIPFLSQRALDDHNADEHFPCHQCDILFWSPRALEEHNIKEHFPCHRCDILLWSQNALDDHDVDKHFLCRPCGRFFMNRNNLQQHMDSSVHKPKVIVCPMRGCSAAFVSVSAALLHCEQGKCPSGVTRRMIDRLVAEADRNGIITDPRRMLEDSGGDQRYPYAPEPTYSATERAWNGSAFECYFCHRTWPRLQSLNSHLGSGVHSETRGLYHCPPQGCEATFSKLSALVQHIEHGSCGVRRFQYVNRAIEGFTSGMRSITAG
jgi:transcription elongation factor Elf1